MLNAITSGLIACMSGYMNTSGGYHGNWASFQQSDFAKVSSYPHCNVYVLDESTRDSQSFPSMNAIRNGVRFQLHCFAKLSEESSNPEFEIDAVLNDMLEDIKRLIGNHYTLGGDLIEYIGYQSSRRAILGNGSDIWMPKYLQVDLLVLYSQDARDPDSGACV